MLAQIGDGGIDIIGEFLRRLRGIARRRVLALRRIGPIAFGHRLFQVCQLLVTGAALGRCILIGVKGAQIFEICLASCFLIVGVVQIGMDIWQIRHAQRGTSGYFLKYSAKIRAFA